MPEIEPTKSPQILLPSKGQTAAIALSEKTAALCYDRVWSIDAQCVPSSIRCFGGSPIERNLATLVTNPDQTHIKMDSLLESLKSPKELLATLGAQGQPVTFELAILKSLYEMLGINEFLLSLALDPDKVKELEPDAKIALAEQAIDLLRRVKLLFSSSRDELLLFVATNLSRFLAPFLRAVAKSFSATHQIPLVPIFQSHEARDRQYFEGGRQTVVFTLSSLNVVDEDQLTWDQVIEFRKDKQTRAKYKRLLHWLDKEMTAKSQAFIEDEIQQKLEDYERVLKKHGIRTVLGTIEETLDGGHLFQAAGSAAVFTLAGHPVLGTLAGAGLLVGKLTVKLIQTKLDFDDVERGPNSEISWVYEVKKVGKS